MKNLLGGKGANLAEMAISACRCRPASPSPPRSAPTTTTTGSLPAELKAQVEKALARRGTPSAGTFGDAENPLLVSVRSGARASMPGMMDTVLNLGLNDQTVEGLAKARRRALRLGQLSPLHQMYSNVVLDVDHHHFEEILEEYKDRKGYTLDTDLTADDWKRVSRATRRSSRRNSASLPAGSAGAALGRDRRRVRLLDEPARHHLPPSCTTSRELGHGGERAGHGVRQHGRDLAPPASPSRATPPPARTSSTASS
jgi:hypothetical protein